MSDAEGDGATDHDDDAITLAEGTRLPAVEVLTGRGFVTGKSGSGKSNTANVVVEDLLSAGHPLLVVDIDGEYWGLKSEYSVLHAGAEQRCDVVVDAEDAETIVDVALDGQPVILDLSGYLSAEETAELLVAVLQSLFRRERDRKQPFLLVVEEIHEFIPQQGSRDDVGDVLLQIAKRGRKHGLGVLGLSQRPAAVDKDFITQCDWLIWHKLTWDNDTAVVSRLLGSDAAEAVQAFDPGEAFVRTDWDDETRRVRVREKRTYDAGTTPGLGERDPPSLVAVDEAVLARFEREKAAEESDADAADSESTAESQASAAASGGNSGRSTPERTTSESSAVDLLVELSFMLAHLAVSAVRYAIRALARGEDRAVAGLRSAIGARTESVPSDRQVRWGLRVLVALAVVAIVLAAG